MSTQQFVSQTNPANARRRAFVYTESGCYEVRTWSNLLVSTEHGAIPIHKIQNVKFLTHVGWVKMNRICHPVSHFGRIIGGTTAEKLNFLTNFPVDNLLKVSNLPRHLHKRWIAYIKKQHSQEPLISFVKSDAELLKIATSDFIPQPDGERAPATEKAAVAGPSQDPPPIQNPLKQKTKKKKKTKVKVVTSEAPWEVVTGEVTESTDFAKTEHMKSVPPVAESKLQMGYLLKTFEKDEFAMAASAYLNTLHSQTKLVTRALNAHLRSEHQVSVEFTSTELLEIAAYHLNNYSPYVVVMRALRGVEKLAKVLAQNLSQLLRSIFSCDKKKEFQEEFLELIRATETEELIRQEYQQRALEKTDQELMHLVADALTIMPANANKEFKKAKERAEKILELTGHQKTDWTKILRELIEKYPQSWKERKTKRVSRISHLDVKFGF